VIRINLLGTERQPKKARVPVFDLGQRLTLACSLILVIAGLLIGWWYWSLTQQSAQVDADLESARLESLRLRSILVEVEQFEQRRQQLQQRVALIEQLRSGQSVPVQMLDLVSKSLPDMLWLTQLNEVGADVTIEGRSTTLIALSDFVGNLGNNQFFKKPIEIVDSQVESVPSGRGTAKADVIKFTVKAQLANPPAASVGAPGRPAAGAKR
jgi:type IV pilus assembly protein PilN